MLLRRDDRGVLAIGQLSHSWISGQLARAWGNARFGEVAPLEDVILGAQEHDLGMSAWDLAPPRNPETGLPVSFTEMPLEVSLEQWRDGPRRLLSQSRYAALLASMHGYKLYGRHNLEAAPAVVRMVHDVAGSSGFQEVSRFNNCFATATTWARTLSRPSSATRPAVRCS